jgi:hypothetical protein
MAHPSPDKIDLPEPSRRACRAAVRSVRLRYQTKNSLRTCDGLRARGKTHLDEFHARRDRLALLRFAARGEDEGRG